MQRNRRELVARIMNLPDLPCAQRTITGVKTGGVQTLPAVPARNGRVAG